MEEKEKLIQLIQEHPEYYKLFPQEQGESKLYLAFLDFVKSQAKSLEQLFQKFSGIEQEDMQIILDYLIKIGLIEKISASNKVFFYATDNARILLEEYEKTKLGFDF
ncbi:MAG: hypothetical protein Q7S21_07965 [archaeon]|nr:hypothetical protein [archaeon]